MSYLDDLALHSVSTERHTYFLRINEEDNVWHRVVTKNEIVWEYLKPYAEVVELMSDGTGKYRRCKKYPMKENVFSKLPETMTMIALQAHTVETI